MTLSQITLLAFIQGLTEFLPVSSSGHLLAARYLFGLDFTDSVAIDGFLHLGTLLAVLLYYWRTWQKILATPWHWHDPLRGSDRRFFIALIIATIPGVVAGLWLKDHPWLLVSPPWRLSLELLATAVILGLTDRFASRLPKDTPNSFDATIIGIAQVLALVPGISRSGITIAGGRARGLSREGAINFSFLMSAPIIAGAGIVSLADLLGGTSLTPTAMLVGFLVSFVSGLVAIRLLLAVIKRMSFTPFIVYLVVLAAILWFK